MLRPGGRFHFLFGSHLAILITSVRGYRGYFDGQTQTSTHEILRGGSMATLTLRLKYRPVRIGWCVRQDNMDDVRSVLLLSHTLWGGRYNPLIPIGDRDVAKRLVEAFRVDVLYPASRDHDFNNFAKSFPYLPHPHFFQDIFMEGSNGKLATFLDIYHPVRHLHEEYVKNLPSPKISAKVFEWNSADPLATVFLASFGSYPSPEESGRDYMKFVQTYLSGQRITISSDHPIDVNAYKHLTPSRITEYRLRRVGWVIE